MFLIYGMETKSGQDWRKKNGCDLSIVCANHFRFWKVLFLRTTCLDLSQTSYLLHQFSWHDRSKQGLKMTWQWIMIVYESSVAQLAMTRNFKPSSCYSMHSEKKKKEKKSEWNWSFFWFRHGEQHSKQLQQMKHSFQTSSHSIPFVSDCRLHITRYKTARHPETTQTFTFLLLR